MAELMDEPITVGGWEFPGGLKVFLTADNKGQGALSGLDPFSEMEGRPEWKSCWFCGATHGDCVEADPFKVWVIVEEPGERARFKCIPMDCRVFCAMHGAKNMMKLLAPCIACLIRRWQRKKRLGFASKWDKLVASCLKTDDSANATDNSTQFFRSRHWSQFCDELDAIMNGEEREEEDSEEEDSAEDGENGRRIYHLPVQMSPRDPPRNFDINVLIRDIMHCISSLLDLSFVEYLTDSQLEKIARFQHRMACYVRAFRLHIPDWYPTTWVHMYTHHQHDLAVRHRTLRFSTTVGVDSAHKLVAHQKRCTWKAKMLVQVLNIRYVEWELTRLGFCPTNLGDYHGHKRQLFITAGPEADEEV